MEYYLGQICHFGFYFSPKGCAPCMGQVISIRENQALYALLGTTYGGDGISTFALPDLRGKSPLDKDETDVHYHIVMQGIFPSRP